MAALAGLPPKSMILPEKQLELLALPMVREHLCEEGLLPAKVDTAIARAARCIFKTTVEDDDDFKDDGILLKQSEEPLLDRLIQTTNLLILKPVTIDIALKHLVGSDPLHPIFTSWHKALKRLDVLPNKIPVLPRNIHHILNSKCPIYSDKCVKDTHLLYLIPPGTVNELALRVMSYGLQLHSNDENPLRFRYFWNKARQQHGDVQFDKYEWILISKDILPGSRNQPFQTQAQMIADLSAKSFTGYQVPTLKEVALAIFLHQIATGESLYQAGNEQNGQCSTFTRVMETIDDRHLVLGGSGPSGVSVGCSKDSANEEFGVVALCKF